MEFWRIIFITVMSGLFLLFISWLVNRKRTGINQCRTGWAVLSIYFWGIFFSLMMSASLYFPEIFKKGLFEDPGSDEIWLKPFGIALTGIFLLSLIDGLKRKIIWDQNGLTVMNFISSSRRHSWNELQTLNYKYFLSYWEMGFSDGTKFRFHELMNGAYPLLSACEEYASPKSNIAISS